MRLTQPTQADWILTTVLLGMYGLMLILGTVLFLPQLWVIWAIIAVTGLLMLVVWHNRRFAYHCPNCGHEFRTSFLRNLLAPHWPNREGGWKYLKCPSCGKRVKAEIYRYLPNSDN